MLMIPRLPGEITDAIIDSVDPDDKRTLANCARVCQQWLPASRRNLFQSIEFDDPFAYDLFLSRVVHSEHMRPWLDSVRTLSIHAIVPRPLYDDTGQDPPLQEVGQPLPIGYRFVHDLAGQLTQLHILRLHALRLIRCPPHSNAYPALWRFSSVRQLELRDVKLPSFNTFCRIFTDLPSLTHLVWNSVSWPYVGGPPYEPWPSPSQSGPSLLHLQITTIDPGSYCDGEFLDWLSQTPSTSSIRSLRFHYQLLYSHPTFFQAAAPHVTDLLVFVPLCYLVSVGLLSGIQLSCFKDLRTFEIQLESLDMSFSECDDGTGMPWNVLMKILGPPSTRLRRLSLMVSSEVMVQAELEGGTVSQVIGLDPFDGFEMIDSLLKQQNCPELEEVHLVFEQKVALPLEIPSVQCMMLDRVKSKIPQLYGRGIVTMVQKQVRAYRDAPPETKERYDSCADAVQTWYRRPWFCSHGLEQDPYMTYTGNGK